MTSTQARLVKDPLVVSREIAGEVILVPIRHSVADLESIYVLNEIAGFVWERLDGQRSLEDIKQAIVRDYEVSPEEAWADIQRFVSQLLENGLLEEA